MPKSKSTESQPHFRIEELPLSRLRDSPFNTRSVYHIDDLVDSIKQVGIIQLLTVRPLDAFNFEVLAGHRRIRAAKEAGLKVVPCIVRDLSDIEALELVVIDNLPESLHPLDEAAGFQKLLKSPDRTYSVEEIAHRIGKTATYVYQRLKLLSLTANAKLAFIQERVSTAHAIEIARLTPEQQDKVLCYVIPQYDGQRAPAATELHKWIQRNFYLDLSQAQFDVADADLVPAAGSCLACPKRTGAQPALFADIHAHDICTDPACYNGKLRAYGRGLLDANRQSAKPLPIVSFGHFARSEFVEPQEVLPLNQWQWVEIDNGEKKCTDAEPAILVSHDPRDMSRVPRHIEICRNPECEIHGDLIDPPEASGGLRRSLPQGDAKEGQTTLNDVRRNQRVCRELIEAIVAEVEKSDMIGRVFPFLAKLLFQDASVAARRLALEWRGVEFAPEASADDIWAQSGAPYFSVMQLLALILAIELCVPIQYGAGAVPDRIRKAAEEFGVDFDAVRSHAAAAGPKHRAKQPASAGSPLSVA